jgi:hypothetical protein
MPGSTIAQASAIFDDAMSGGAARGTGWGGSSSSSTSCASSRPRSASARTTRPGPF